MLVLPLAAAAALLVALYALYCVFLHPLSHVPGPWYAAVGTFWDEWQQFTLHYSRAIEGLHKKYGPVVRIGQNKVAFVDEQAQKAVYGTTSRLPRDKYYKRFATSTGDHAMTILDHTAWANRRKATAAHYSTPNLAHYEQEIEKYTLTMVDGLLADNGQHSFDLMSVFRHLLVDIVFSTAFDLHNGTLEKWSRGEVDELDQAVTDFPKLTLVVGLFPPPVFAVLKIIVSAVSSRLRLFFDADNILNSAAKRVYNRFAADSEILGYQPVANGNGNVERKTSLIQRLMEYRYSGPEENGRGMFVDADAKVRRMREDEVLSESQAHLIAGSETTATTAAMIIWELTQQPDLLEKVRAEVDDNVREHSVANWKLLFGQGGRLSMFNGFIKEGLRLYAVIPGPLPRILVSPLTINPTSPTYPRPASVYGSEGKKTFTLPKGTTVSTQSWSLHRQSDVFADPLVPRPERWIEGENGSTKEELDKMNANFIPFGVGPRMCVGQNLGQTMLRVIVSTIVRHFDIVPAPETTKETMAIWESFALFPKGLQARFYLKPRLHH